MKLLTIAAPLFFAAAVSGAVAQTAQELRAKITDRDRRITEQQNQIERLRYAAGSNVIKGSEILTPRLHDDTIAKVAEVNQSLSNQVSQVAENADQARKAAIDAAYHSGLVSAKLDQAKEEATKTLIEAIAAQVIVFLTVIAGFIRTDLRERRNHKWALEADRARQDQLATHKKDVDNKLETITALLDGTKKKTVDWKDLQP